MHSRLSAFVILALIAVASAAPAQQPSGEVDFSRDIQPLLVARCIQCHGPEKQESGLRLDSGPALVRGGDNGLAVVAGKPAESLLILAVTGQSDVVSKMPAKGEPLAEVEIALLRRWIDAGAKVPAETLETVAKSNHWSFQPVRRPNVPRIQSPIPARRDKIQNPIDAFVAAKLEEHDLSPSSDAHRATLIRRAALDLIGLPPSLDEVDAFIADGRPDAYERLIDRLIASPHYGERWGRHWLDLARYADSNGYTRDFGRQIWKYREWVIDAINRNLPFDQFTIEQIAGDMLPDATEEQLVATGFHRNTLINEEGGTDQEQFRIEAVADRVNTTGAVWLGLTIGCARCHSHKYDPITQVEYYQLFALLNNCDEPTIEVPTRIQRERGELARREQIRGQIKRLEEEVERQRPELEARQREWEAAITPQQRARLPGPVQVAFDMKFEKRDEKNKKIIEDYYRQSEAARQAFPLLQQIYELREVEPKIPTTMILRERAEPRQTYVHRRGDFLDRGPEVIGGVPAVLPPLVSASGGRQPPNNLASEQHDQSSEGPDPSETITNAPNRLDFARWLVSSDNPLTPRVAMNRDWQKFFGRGLVETEDDFGSQGTPPSHRELLDWLAVEFVESGWNVKRMHRQIVTSAIYCQSSNSELGTRNTESQHGLASSTPQSAIRNPHLIDPQNKLLWRQVRLRLDAEIVRDVALTASGLLTRTIGGPSVFPPQPEGVFDFTQDPKPWIAAAGGDRYRRGMYTHFWRSSPYPMLLAFDAPSGNVSCTRRLRSNTPLQSLTLANDQAFFECARALAAKVIASHAHQSASGGIKPPDNSASGERSDSATGHKPAEAAQSDLARARLAFRLCVSREPTAAESDLLARLVATEISASPSQPEAAWTRICRVLLNLDETISRE